MTTACCLLPALCSTNPIALGSCLIFAIGDEAVIVDSGGYNKENHATLIHELDKFNHIHIIITHDHSDHVGNFPSILRSTKLRPKIENVWWNPTPESPIADNIAALLHPTAHDQLKDAPLTAAINATTTQGGEIATALESLELKPSAPLFSPSTLDEAPRPWEGATKKVWAHLGCRAVSHGDELHTEGGMKVVQINPRAKDWMGADTKDADLDASSLCLHIETPHFRVLTLSDCRTPEIDGMLRDPVPGTTGRLEVPAAKADLPSVKADLPSVKADLPSVKADLPSVKADLPSVKADLPSVKANLAPVEAEPIATPIPPHVKESHDLPTPHGQRDMGAECDPVTVVELADTIMSSHITPAPLNDAPSCPPLSPVDIDPNGYDLITIPHHGSSSAASHLLAHIPADRYFIPNGTSAQARLAPDSDLSITLNPFFEHIANRCDLGANAGWRQNAADFLFSVYPKRGIRGLSARTLKLTDEGRIRFWRQVHTSGPIYPTSRIARGQELQGFTRVSQTEITTVAPPKRKALPRTGRRPRIGASWLTGKNVREISDHEGVSKATVIGHLAAGQSPLVPGRVSSLCIPEDIYQTLRGIVLETVGDGPLPEVSYSLARRMERLPGVRQLMTKLKLKFMPTHHLQGTLWRMREEQKHAKEQEQEQEKNPEPSDLEADVLMLPEEAQAEVKPPSLAPSSVNAPLPPKEARTAPRTPSLPAMALPMPAPVPSTAAGGLPASAVEVAASAAKPARPSPQAPLSHPTTEGEWMQHSRSVLLERLANSEAAFQLQTQPPALRPDGGSGPDQPKGKKIRLGLLCGSRECVTLLAPSATYVYCRRKCATREANVRRFLKLGKTHAARTPLVEAKRKELVRWRTKVDSDK